MDSVYIALGSNLKQPRRQLDRAVRALKRLPRSHFQKVSGYYRTEPVGPAGQPSYLNAVAKISTRLSPLELLHRLQVQEKLQHRKRSVRWGPRTIDLDILLFGQRRMCHRDLTVPHYAMCHRDFVLIPLLEIAPANLSVPGHGTLSQLARERGLGQD